MGVNNKKVNVLIRNILYHPKSQREPSNAQIVFSYHEHSTINDLYTFIIQELELEEYYLEPSSLRLRFHINNNGEQIYYRLDYDLSAFIKEHSNNNLLILDFTARIPGGMGANLFELANIRINPNERQHKYTPHIHVSPYQKQSPTVRIELNSLTQMYGDNIQFNNVFTKKEQKEILEFLTLNREKLISYYERVQKGEYIPHFLLEFKGQSVDFH